MTFATRYLPGIAYNPVAQAAAIVSSAPIAGAPASNVALSDPLLVTRSLDSSANPWLTLTWPTPVLVGAVSLYNHNLLPTVNTVTYQADLAGAAVFDTEATIYASPGTMRTADIWQADTPIDTLRVNVTGGTDEGVWEGGYLYVGQSLDTDIGIAAGYSHQYIDNSVVQRNAGASVTARREEILKSIDVTWTHLTEDEARTKLAFLMGVLGVAMPVYVVPRRDGDYQAIEAVYGLPTYSSVQPRTNDNTLFVTGMQVSELRSGGVSVPVTAAGGVGVPGQTINGVTLGPRTNI